MEDYKINKSDFYRAPLEGFSNVLKAFEFNTLNAWDSRDRLYLWQGVSHHSTKMAPRYHFLKRLRELLHLLNYRLRQVCAISPGIPYHNLRIRACVLWSWETPGGSSGHTQGGHAKTSFWNSGPAENFHPPSQVRERNLRPLAAQSPRRGSNPRTARSGLET